MTATETSFLLYPISLYPGGSATSSRAVSCEVRLMTYRAVSSLKPEFSVALPG